MKAAQEFIKLLPALRNYGIKALFAGGDNPSNTVNNIDFIYLSNTSNAQDFGDLNTPGYGIGSESNGSGNRGIFAGGREDPTSSNAIQYVNFHGNANTQDFGDLINTVYYIDCASNKSNNRCLFAGGYNSTNIISYITINSFSNSIDFGDLIESKYSLSGLSNGISNRAVFTGGRSSITMDYVTITSTGNASTFGNLTVERGNTSSTSNLENNRGVHVGGFVPTSTLYNIIDYITINSLSDASDFGDLTDTAKSPAATSNGIQDRALIGGGQTTGTVKTNRIDYITITVLSNASDFGDLTDSREALCAASNSG